MSESNTGEILLYKSDEGDIKINVVFKDETIWLSQKQMGELFGVQENNITYHLGNIYNEEELDKNSTTQKIGVVQKEGEREVKREVAFYNLDAIIAVGYRVNSYKATKFRIWATNVLKEYVIKGFVMDDERLKNGSHFGKDYFEELLARIREIRASERRFYQKITDIYATSVDYDTKAQITKDFFAEVQNKFLFAVSGNTAPELEYHRSDASKPNMGLTTGKSQKTGGKILTTDIKIGKNYLTEEELTNLNLLVSGYLDFAELQARNGKIMKMQDWIDKTRSFLELNDMKVLDGKGTISKIQLEESYNVIKQGDNNIIEIIENLCELVENLSGSYKNGNDAKKGKIIRAMQCELIINNKKELVIKENKLFEIIKSLNFQDWYSRKILC